MRDGAGWEGGESRGRGSRGLVEGAFDGTFIIRFIFLQRRFFLASSDIPGKWLHCERRELTK